jgi:hypothetical protein
MWHRSNSIAPLGAFSAAVAETTGLSPMILIARTAIYLLAASFPARFSSAAFPISL